jgi:hypothetical protein
LTHLEQLKFVTSNVVTFSHPVPADARKKQRQGAYQEGEIAA